MQPFECVNVRFDRSGGYAAQPDSKLLNLGVGNISKVFWAGKANHLFVSTTSQIFYWDNSSATGITGTTGVDLGGVAYQTTPGRMMNYYSGVEELATRLSITGKKNVFRTPPTIPFWDGSGTGSADIVWSYLADSGGFFDAATETASTVYRCYVLAVDKDDPNIDYSWYTYFDFGTGSANPPSSASPPITGKYNVSLLGGPMYEYHLYWVSNSTRKIWEGIYAGDGAIELDGTPEDASQKVFPESFYDGFFPFGQSSTYHNNRVWVACNTGSKTIFAFRKVSGTTPASTKEALTGPRLYYSEIVGPNTNPVFLSDYYIDPPFKVSNEIIGVIGVGRYLYVFGDREVLVLSGNSDADFQIESIGDSIGAVRRNSIASLGGVVYWVSDSGVMAAQGGQVAEVGGDVRWTVTNMDQTKLTSTVDFSRELYFLSDGTTTLVFDAREKKWSTRTGTALGLGNYQLAYGGGTAYCLAGSSPSVLALYDESNLTANKLEARVLWGDYENGSWDLRKTLSQITFGGQVSGGTMSIKNLSKVDAMSSLTDENTLTSASVGKVSLIPVDSAGVQLSGNVMRIGFSFQPSGTNEGVVRGPIQVYGSVKGEEQR